MKTILVATDFSTRSDRALRRASLLARRHDARMVVVHAVDDDQPQKLVNVHRDDAETVLSELVATARSTDGLDCESLLASGSADEAVIRTADDVDADIVVVGSHRSRPFRDVFLGTTIDRILRRSRRPVLVAKALPAGDHRQIFIGVDMTEGSERAIETARRLGFFEGARLGVVHVFAARGQELMLHAASTTKEVEAYIERQRSAADQELKSYLASVGLEPDFRMIELAEASVAETIDDCARDQKSDLVVIGTVGRSSLSRFVLGSVAQGVLRAAACDVLVVPAPAPE